MLDTQLIVPTVFHVPINGRDARLKRIRSGDRVDDQSLGRSCDRFPGSRVGKSRDCLEAGRSRETSRDGLGNPGFPGSRGR